MEMSVERLDKVIALLPAELSARQLALLRQFAPLYFARLSEDDARELADSDLAGMLLTQFALLDGYSGRAAAIRVFNPDVERDRYGSGRSVIEIVVRDRPFLVDTLVMALDEAGASMHRLLHTIVHIRRDAEGAVAAIEAAADSNEKQVSVMYCELARLDEGSCAAVEQRLRAKISVLDTIAGDWQAMHDKLAEVQAALTDEALRHSAYPAAEVRAFLDWILDNHFTFLGFREYRIIENDLGNPEWHRVGGSGLGVLREKGVDKISASFAELPENLRLYMMQPQVMLLSKADKTAPVHRPVYMDMLGIQKIDADGRVLGEFRFLGLLTVSAYQLTPDKIPLLRCKVDAVMQRAALPKGGHAYKKMLNILNQMPRDDLFQADVDTLYPMALGILQLQDRERLRLFTRVDLYERFVSCLVYVPRDKFSTAMREKMQCILKEAVGGTATEFDTHFSDGHHARVHVHVRTVPGQIKPFDTAAVEAKLTAAMRSWEDDFAASALKFAGEAEGSTLLAAFAGAFPAAYQEKVPAAEAAADAQRLSRLSADEPLSLHLFQSSGERENRLHLKVYGMGDEPTLTYILPKLEHFGVLVRAAYPFRLANGKWMQLYDLELARAQGVDMRVAASQFETALVQVMRGSVESDRLNELVLTTALHADEVVILRALSRYMIQARAPFSADYIHQTLINNIAIAVDLIALFHARLDPVQQDEAKAAMLTAQIEAALAAVKSLDEDRILHWYLTLITAALRTNYYQREPSGLRKDRLAIKFNSQAIPELPKPRPMAEIYVYSPRVEAVHLRGGKVARGGLRWSDRMEDYRTEVLGLVKAQMVKNAVIVPVGSKGGFVVKNPPESREAMLEEGIACYKTFIRGLLDITDNLDGSTVMPPKDTVCRDSGDPYLVVAADKGTASFSDIANSIAQEYGFWLGDAFASGGSVGYDHKGMGITARGGWESVKRHFRLMGKDIQNEDFTVIGIGDMSGDVFGNAMLLSRHIRLLAAFNHLHIFIDPTPDIEASFAERERLFKLPRSHWGDYDVSLISAGGGIFPRSAKTIAITPEMREAFAIEEDSLSPNELINRLLKAPVELIWNGGIGTYVKHSEETHLDVGDRANDGLRVNGCEVRAKVIGEGGNLGVTQRGRIEYAQHGGRIYTDAIDNSAGVNCSDHEVNIKILLNAVVSQGDMTEKQRNELLASMTDEVAELVLRQNYLQPQAIETAAADPSLLEEHAAVIRMLEREGRLDRAIEYLPDDAEIACRQKAGVGLTNPELAVLLAYSKMHLYDELLDSPLPDNSYFTRELTRYFPAVLAEKYPSAMNSHRLHREITATYLTNSLINRMGAGFIYRAGEESGQYPSVIASAYAAAREIFGVRADWHAIAALDNHIDAAVQIRMEQQLRRLIETGVQWLLRHLPKPIDVQTAIERFQPATAAYAAQSAANADADAVARWQDMGLDEAAARRCASLPALPAALDIALLAEETGEAAENIAAIYQQVQARIHSRELSAQIRALPIRGSWDRRAAAALLSSLTESQQQIVRGLLGGGQTLESWQLQKAEDLERLDNAVHAAGREAPSLAALSVILGSIAALK